MNTDIMIDLETLDVLPTATILTIGAVKFDPFGDDINEKKAEKFYVRVDVDSCDALGGTVSQSTLEWWAQQEKAAQDALVEALMKEFSIDHLRKSPALSLSGGERRRCEIARALASRPSFILLDEPLAGIDPIAVAEIREMVSHLKDRGLGVLITDHNVRETLDIIDRAYILHEGTVLMEGTPSEIVAHEGVRRVYLGERFSL